MRRVVLVFAALYAAGYLVDRSGALDREQARYSSDVTGPYETIRSNCGNRLASTGSALHVSSFGWTVLRGEEVGAPKFDEAGAAIGGVRFYRC